MRQEFQAFRGTSWNAIFPDSIIIEDDTVTLYKQRVIGHDSTAIPRSNISSVSCSQGLMFSDICIETFGGQRFVLNGFMKSDASAIARLLSR